MKENYPEADYSIVLCNDKPIGRFCIHKGSNIWRLLYIAILTEYRNKGIGGKLVEKILVKASKASKNIRLHVFWYNRRDCSLYKK